MPISSRRLLRQRSAELTATKMVVQQGGGHMCLLPPSCWSDRFCDSSISASSEESSETVNELPKTEFRTSAAAPEKKHVSFGAVDVRFYDVVVGDHPCCSTGCAISFGWSYQTSVSQSLDEFESSRCGHRRSLSDLKTTWTQRHDRLVEAAATMKEREESNASSSVCVTTAHEIRRACRLQQRNQDRRVQRAQHQAFFQRSSS